VIITRASGWAVHKPDLAAMTEEVQDRSGWALVRDIMLCTYFVVAADPHVHQLTLQFPLFRP
jgi:hypothetical protein